MQESDLKKKADSHYCENEVFFIKKECKGGVGVGKNRK